MSYPPLGTSVEQLVAEAETILRATGADKVHWLDTVWAGVVITQAIADRRLDGRVDTAIILGSPFGGSPWAAVVLCRHRAGAAGRLAGVARVASAPSPDGARWLSVTPHSTSSCRGLQSIPSHTQVETITFDGVGHLGMPLSRQVIGCITAELCTPQTVGEARMPVLPSVP